jgi:hypothetical protein
MKKIMFNDKFGLTQAVLEGRKTMTRRIIHAENIPDDPEYGYAPNIDACCVFNEDDVVAKSQYNLCEVVAIAQAYEDVYAHYIQTAQYKKAKDVPEETAGEGNKMFVKAEFMPHHIKITNIEVEHLQEDCLREGVVKNTIGYYVEGLKCKDWEKESHIEMENGETLKLFPTPREAFAALIDKVSGKGTWESNPLVWVYEFELVD